ncbi:MAG: hypothetical protein K0S24_377 [Sphingobacterium sp.]|nr:hypothetical protein [Sphingobacterium sp.]
MIVELVSRINLLKLPDNFKMVSEIRCKLVEKL